MFQYKRILVPLDGSVRAEKVLKPTLQLALKMSAELVLLRVVPTLKLVAPFVRLDRSSKDAQAQQQRKAGNSWCLWRYSNFAAGRRSRQSHTRHQTGRIANSSVGCDFNFGRCGWRGKLHR